MRSKILVITAAVLLFGVGFAVYAYNSTTNAAETVAASSCNCCGDSCPMKSKDAKATGESTHECCCKGDADSCPMKSKDAKATDGKHSCPMMSGDAAHKMDAAKHEGMAGHGMKMANAESCPMMKDGKKHTADGESGHSCCGCCSHSKERKDTTEKGAI